MLGAGLAAAVDLPILERAGYSLCAGEANDAMGIGRMVTVFKVSREELVNDGKLTPYLRDIAVDYFRASAAGEAPTHVHFALRRFAVCLEKQQVPLPGNEEMMLSCLSRTDIPVFYGIRKEMGDAAAVAAERVEAAMANREYPAGMVRALAAPSYTVQDSEGMRGLQLFLFNSCLFPPEQVGAYYGFSPPAPASASASTRPKAGPGAATGAGAGKAGGKGGGVPRKP